MFGKRPREVGQLCHQAHATRFAERCPHGATLLVSGGRFSTANNLAPGLPAVEVSLEHINASAEAFVPS